MVFNFPIIVIASAAFVKRALDSTILLDLSASRQLFAIFITDILYILESSVQNFFIPTANLLIIPGLLIYLDCLSPMISIGIKYFLMELKISIF